VPRNDGQGAGSEVALDNLEVCAADTARCDADGDLAGSRFEFTDFGRFERPSGDRLGPFE
jgi:hypothetical protein